MKQAVLRVCPDNRSERVWLASIVFLALVLRVTWVLYARADPLDGRFNDSVFYHVVAAHLAEGGGYTNPYTFLPTAQWAPGFIFLLTPFYWLFGPHYQIAELINASLGAATVGVLYLLAKELLDSTVARTAAAVLALFPGQIMFTSLLYSETLFTFVVVLALLLLVRSMRSTFNWRVVALFGVTVGAAALVKGNGIWLLFALPIYGCLGLRGWKRVLRMAVIAGSTAGLVILPWAVRNTITLDSPVIISTSAGVNVWQGHHEGAGGGNEPPIDLVSRFGPLSRPGAEVAMNDAGFREGREYALTHPRDEFWLSLRKVRELYKHDSIAVDLNEDFGAHGFIPHELERALRAAANSYYFTVLALAAVCVVLQWRVRQRGLLLPALMVLIWTLGHVVIFGQPRYHIPIMPMFCILAAWTLVKAFNATRTRLRRPDSDRLVD